MWRRKWMEVFQKWLKEFFKVTELLSNAEGPFINSTRWPLCLPKNPLMGLFKGKMTLGEEISDHHDKWSSSPVADLLIWKSTTASKFSWHLFHHLLSDLLDKLCLRCYASSYNSIYRIKVLIALFPALFFPHTTFFWPLYRGGWWLQRPPQNSQQNQRWLRVWSS